MIYRNKMDHLNADRQNILITGCSKEEIHSRQSHLLSPWCKIWSIMPSLQDHFRGKKKSCWWGQGYARNPNLKTKTNLWRTLSEKWRKNSSDLFRSFIDTINLFKKVWWIKITWFLSSASAICCCSFWLFFCCTSKNRTPIGHHTSYHDLVGPIHGLSSCGL